MVHADLVNADHLVADEHINVAIRQFGSYGDGFIRNRKMYVFPHPITIDPGGIERHRLIVPATWKLGHSTLRRVSRLERTIAAEAIESYTIRLYGRGQAEDRKIAYEDAGATRTFDVFEMA